MKLRDAVFLNFNMLSSQFPHTIWYKNDILYEPFVLMTYCITIMYTLMENSWCIVRLLLNLMCRIKKSKVSSTRNAHNFNKWTSLNKWILHIVIFLQGILHKQIVQCIFSIANTTLSVWKLSFVANQIHVTNSIVEFCFK